MKRLLAIVALVMLSAPTLWTDGLPPKRFMKDATAGVAFVHPSKIQDMCGLETPADKVLLACTRSTRPGTGLILIPNPCLSAQTEEYANLLCHELGHVNGWPRTHGE